MVKRFKDSFVSYYSKVHIHYNTLSILLILIVVQSDHDLGNVCKPSR